jgi:hypothetical protein
MEAVEDRKQDKREGSTPKLRYGHWSVEIYLRVPADRIGTGGVSGLSQTAS